MKNPDRRQASSGFEGKQSLPPFCATQTNSAIRHGSHVGDIDPKFVVFVEGEMDKLALEAA